MGWGRPREVCRDGKERNEALERWENSEEEMALLMDEVSSLRLGLSSIIPSRSACLKSHFH